MKTIAITPLFVVKLLLYMAIAYLAICLVMSASFWTDADAFRSLMIFASDFDVEAEGVGMRQLQQMEAAFVGIPDTCLVAIGTTASLLLYGIIEPCIRLRPLRLGMAVGTVAVVAFLSIRCYKLAAFSDAASYVAEKVVSALEQAPDPAATVFGRDYLSQIWLMNHTRWLPVTMVIAAGFVSGVFSFRGPKRTVLHFQVR